MPVFSVIVPIFNSEPTLSRCLDSVLAQTFQDFEVLCCYDESADESKKIIEEYVRKDERIRFVQGRSKGLSGARNDGLNAANGRYILFLDADDAFVPTAFDRIEREFKKRKCDIVVFGSAAVPENPRPSFWHEKVLRTRNKFYKVFKENALFGELSARPFVWRDSFRKEFLAENSLFFDENLRVGEDQVFQLETFPFAAGGISYISDKLYEYTHYRADSLMAQYNKKRLFKLAGHLQMVRAAADFWMARGFSKCSKKNFLAWAVDFLSCDILSLSKDDFQKLLPEIQKTAKVLSLFEKKTLPHFFRRRFESLILCQTKTFSRKATRFYNLRRDLYFYGLSQTVWLKCASFKRRLGEKRKQHIWG